MNETATAPADRPARARDTRGRWRGAATPARPHDPASVVLVGMVVAAFLAGAVVTALVLGARRPVVVEVDCHTTGGAEIR